jgi:hypothetical protein
VFIGKRAGFRGLEAVHLGQGLLHLLVVLGVGVVLRRLVLDHPVAVGLAGVRQAIRPNLANRRQGFQGLLEPRLGLVALDLAPSLVLGFRPRHPKHVGS